MDGSRKCIALEKDEPNVEEGYESHLAIERNRERRSSFQVVVDFGKMPPIISKINFFIFMGFTIFLLYYNERNLL